MQKLLRLCLLLWISTSLYGCGFHFRGQQYQFILHKLKPLTTQFDSSVDPTLQALINKQLQLSGLSCKEKNPAQQGYLLKITNQKIIRQHLLNSTDLQHHQYLLTYEIHYALQKNGMPMANSEAVLRTDKIWNQNALLMNASNGNYQQLISAAQQSLSQKLLLNLQLQATCRGQNSPCA